MTGSVLPVLGYILKGFPRISESFISNEILQLEARGFSIHIFSLRRPRECFTHHSVQRIQAPVDYLPETLLAPLPRLIHHNALLAAGRPQVYARTLGTVARGFRRTRKWATFEHLLQAGYLVQHLLPESGVTHLHAHFAHSPTSVAMFAAMLSGLPFSFSAHAKDIYTLNPEQIREKVALSRFVVTCTEYNKQHLLRITANRSTPIHRIYHGIDLALFSGSENIKNPSPPFRVLTVARLVPKKGLPTVLRAMRQLKDWGMGVSHTVIGDGEGRDKMMSLARRLGLGEVTEWLGTLPHHQVLAHYRRADLFVLGCEITPDGDRDGMPNVLVEAMAMGVPVVATRVSAIPELVTDGETGLLVPAGESEPMARAMHRMLTDTNLRGRIVSAAKQRVTEKFDNRRLIRQLARVFESAVVSGKNDRNRKGAKGRE
ncbi:MAG: glycosyltransferase [Candidatus Thiosymbion ectosymbiont of Robbea hypermnestra]|nr:glycosyltransferase [Candidatus Thiosymbion ectosymbiont of Robbea hypermnestra]